MRPHYSQSSRENATPSIGTSPLAFYKEVPSPGPKIEAFHYLSCTTMSNCKGRIKDLNSLGKDLEVLMAGQRYFATEY